MKKHTSTTTTTTDASPKYRSPREGAPLTASIACAFCGGVAFAIAALALGYGPLAAFIAYSLGGSAALAGFATVMTLSLDRTTSLLRIKPTDAVR